MGGIAIVRERIAAASPARLSIAGKPPIERMRPATRTRTSVLRRNAAWPGSVDTVGFARVAPRGDSALIGLEKLRRGLGFRPFCPI